MGRAALLVLVAVQAQAAPRATADPPAVVLGEDREVLIRLTGLESTRLYAQSSAGLLVEAGDPGPGARTFRWTPPDIHYPGVAVLLFWQPSPKGTGAAVLRIPLTGQTTLTMQTEPTATVEVQVGPAVFGPATANARGRVALPIQVPPGVQKAVVTATSHGRQTTRIVDLDVPEMRPWIAALGPDPLPREGGWLMVIHAGRFQNASEVKVHATGASVTRTDSNAEQLVFRVMPERGAEAVALEIATPEGERRRLELPVSATPQRPDQLLRLSALAGGFAAGGANAGPALELGASIPLLRGLAAELALGARFASLRRDVEILGPVRSSLLVFPVDAAIRFRALHVDRFGLDLRGAVGIAPFRHTVSAAYQSPYAEAGIGFDSFGAAQGRYAFGEWELALELRAAYTTARTPRLTAFPGGFAALAGAGWVIR